MFNLVEDIPGHKADVAHLHYTIQNLSDFFIGEVDKLLQLKQPLHNSDGFPR